MLIIYRRRFSWLRMIGYVLAGCFALYLFLSRREFFAFRTLPSKLAATARMAQNGQVLFGWAKDKFNRPIFYLLAGDTDKPVLCLVHGSPGSSSAWMAYLANRDLYKHFRLLVIDRPGFGYSTFGQAEKTLAGQAEALRAVMDGLHLSQAVFAGHSLGGPVIAKYAAIYPTRISGLVFLAASVDPDLEPRYWWQRPLDHPALSWLLPPAFKVSNREIIPLSSELRDMDDEWKNMDHPTLIIHGTKDILVPFANVGFMQKRLPRHPQVISLEGESHFFIWTRSEEVIKGITDFTQVQPGPKPVK